MGIHFRVNISVDLHKFCLTLRIDVRGIISIFYTAGVAESVRGRGALVCIRAERKGVHKLGSRLSADVDKVFAELVKQTLFGLRYSGGAVDQAPDDGYAFPGPQVPLDQAPGPFFILSGFSHQV